MKVSSRFETAMKEVWLKPNRRALAFGLIAPMLLLLLAGLLFYTGDYRLAAVGGLIVCLALPVSFALVRAMLRPRLEFAQDKLAIFLREGAPVRVPIEFVECFLLGQGPSLLGRTDLAESATLIIRLADRAEQWSRMEVRPALGKWCDGYVTIRGTWCEPLNLEVVRRLNSRLAEVSPAARSSVKATAGKEI